MGCRCCTSFVEHIRSIGFSYKAAPQTNARERALSADLAAFRRLTEDGLEPKGIDGMAALEARGVPAHVIEGTIPMIIEAI